ncbi:hypothetical protein H9Q70_010058 [Fusarium xylarioides]|nr:hypothetical protein H9Q70_010058 [Fusarium xylarioides]KAG5776597.1 hypothetical protein H9Q73_009731 [Fusarium xylarioides]
MLKTDRVTVLKEPYLNQRTFRFIHLVPFPKTWTLVCSSVYRLAYFYGGPPAAAIAEGLPLTARHLHKVSCQLNFRIS